MKEEKVREFLTLKQDSLSVHEYGLNFTQLSRYALNMVKDYDEQNEFVCRWCMSFLKKRR